MLFVCIKKDYDLLFKTCENIVKLKCASCVFHWNTIDLHSLYFQDHLLKEGLAWLDSQASGEAQYWLPALFSEIISRDVTPEEANQMTP